MDTLRLWPALEQGVQDLEEHVRSRVEPLERRVQELEDLLDRDRRDRVAALDGRVQDLDRRVQELKACFDALEGRVNACTDYVCKHL